MSIASNSSPSPPHLLVIPFPAQGHLIALLDLLPRLLTLIPDLTATVLVTPANLPLLSPLFSSPASNHHFIQPLVLPFPSSSSLPPGVEHARGLPTPTSVAALIRSLSLLRPQIVSWARSLTNPPTAILSDSFLGWTHHLAADLSLPRLAFYSVRALLVSIFDHLFLRGASGPLPPPIPPFPYHHLPSIFRRYEAARSDPDWEFLTDSMIANRHCHAAVINTFDALESKYLSHLKATYGHDRVWAVGPISPAASWSADRGGRISAPAESLLSWLAPCPPRSVVYVCFGSQFLLGAARARALASALELSGARFLWCVGSAEVPDGFEERTAGKGLVVRGWAPQSTLLGQGAVGSFLTHCGWNSVLEGIAAGALLLTWPMEADQFVNAQLLVEDAQVAVSACEGGPDCVPEAEELARVIAESVDPEKGLEVKARAVEIRKKAAEAVAEGGSSSKDMQRLVKELRAVN